MRSWNRELNTCIHRLGSGDPALREQAEAALIAMGPEAVPELCRAVGEDRFGEAASGVLERMGEAAFPALAQVVLEGSAVECQGAMTVLSRSGDPRAVSAIAPALHSPDPAVSGLALKHITAREAAVAVPVLCHHWGGCPPAIQVGILAALRRYQDPQSVPTLIWGVSHSYPRVRDEAIRTLCVVGDARAVPALIRYSPPRGADSQAQWRWAALRRIGAEAVPDLIGALQGDAPTREFALEALRRIGSPAVPALSALVRRGGTLACAVADLLREIGDPAAVPDLMEVLSTGSLKLRHRAVVALGSLRDARAIPALHKSLEEPTAALRRAAALALVACGDGGAHLTPPLLSALQEGGATQMAAVEALCVLARDRPFVALVQAVPLLQSLARINGLLQPELRAACLATIAAIEEATEPLRTLPVPTTRPEAEFHALPRPGPNPEGGT